MRSTPRRIDSGEKGSIVVKSRVTSSLRQTSTQLDLGEMIETPQLGHSSVVESCIAYIPKDQR